jgi:hypothetical protein
MKYFIAFLIVFLLVTGIVSAAAPGPVSVQIVKTVAPANSTTIRPVSVEQGALVTQNIPVGSNILDSVPVGINIVSVPPNATLTVDGVVKSFKTPIKINLQPGSHTLVISYDGYRDHTTTITVKAGMPDASLMVNLEPLIERVRVSMTVQREDMQGLPISKESPVQINQSTIIRNLSSATGLGAPTTPGSVPFSPEPPAPVDCINADWSCLTLAEATAAFGNTYARYGNLACGYTGSGDQMVAKYCCKDILISGALSPESLSAKEIPEGADIYIFNETGIQHGIVNKSSALQESKAVDSNPIQQIFDFFSNIFGGSKKPTSRLEIVGFAPQPEPPGKVYVDENAQEQAQEQAQEHAQK